MSQNLQLNRSTRQNSNFERTMELLQQVLQGRLRDGYRKIWVQGCNRPSNVTLIFTIFPEVGNYQMRFLDIRNFRQFRQEGDMDQEMELLHRHISSFEPTLSEYINYEPQS
jgi:hypothetical protein